MIISLIYRMYTWVVEKRNKYFRYHCFCSVTKSCLTLLCNMSGFSVPHHLLSLPKLMSTESEMPSNHLILCHPLLFLPSIFPSITVFSSELAVHIRWPKYRSFSFSISPSNEYSWLISFRIELVWSPCYPRDSQESSPAPQSESINSLALCLLYFLALTSVHDYWKDHNLEYMDFCWRSDIFAF